MRASRHSRTSWSNSCSTRALPGTRAPKIPVTSRMLITPSTCPPSTTGRCLIHLTAISRAASRSGMSGETVNTSAVITSSTVAVARSAPRATARSRSRSVMIPASRSPSMTSREPVCSRHMRSAAERSVSVAESVTAAPVITSRTSTAMCSCSRGKGLLPTLGSARWPRCQSPGGHGGRPSAWNGPTRHVARNQQGTG